MVGLERFLIANGYPRAVFLSEDGTRVTPHVQYDPRSRTITGCVAPLDGCGLPKRKYFCTKDPHQVLDKLESSPVASTAYVIVATPLAPNAQSFVLFYMGTDNKFKHVDVLNRWRYIIRLLRSHGIFVLGFGSDGDPTLLKAMVTRMRFFASGRSVLGDLFVLQLQEEGICFQDTIHLLLKIVRRLFKRPGEFKIGNTQPTVAHLDYLVAHVGKSLHRLERSDLHPTDLQSFKPTQKIIREDFINLLESEVPESEGTVALLRYMRAIYLSFTDETLRPLERISMCWYYF